MSPKTTILQGVWRAFGGSECAGSVRLCTPHFYLGSNGRAEIRMLVFDHERTCIHGPRRTQPARPHRRPFARMAAAPPYEPARSRRRGGDLGAAFEFRRD